jgi:hypothetical protein
VGSISVNRAQPGHFCIDGQFWLFVSVGVASHDPEAATDVRGIDSASRNIKRPAGVCVFFQVRKDRVEPQVDESNNILSKHPSGPLASDDFKHCRPEVAVILRAHLLPGM